MSSADARRPRDRGRPGGATVGRDPARRTSTRCALYGPGTEREAIAALPALRLRDADQVFEELDAGSARRRGAGLPTARSGRAGRECRPRAATWRWLYPRALALHIEALAACDPAARRRRRCGSHLIVLLRLDRADRAGWPRDRVLAVVRSTGAAGPSPDAVGAAVSPRRERPRPGRRDLRRAARRSHDVELGLARGALEELRAVPDAVGPIAARHGSVRASLARDRRCCAQEEATAARRRRARLRSAARRPPRRSSRRTCAWPPGAPPRPRRARPKRTSPRRRRSSRTRAGLPRGAVPGRRAASGKAASPMRSPAYGALAGVARRPDPAIGPGSTAARCPARRRGAGRPGRPSTSNAPRTRRSDPIPGWLHRRPGLAPAGGHRRAAGQLRGRCRDPRRCSSLSRWPLTAPPQFRTSVDVVRIEALVLDTGRPVAGLGTARLRGHRQRRGADDHRPRPGPPADRRRDRARRERQRPRRTARAPARGGRALVGQLTPRIGRRWSPSTTGDAGPARRGPAALDARLAAHRRRRHARRSSTR